MNAYTRGLATALSFALCACDNMDIKAEKKEVKPAAKATPQNFKGKIDLSSDLIITSNGEDIIFEEGSVIVTNGFNFEIKGSAVEFHNSVIKTFEETKAEGGQKGLSGGKIKISAEHAIGHLNLNTNGQDGGDGVEPPAMGEEFRGGRGADGQPAVYKWIDGISAAGNYCFSNPTPGGQGDKGVRGRAGASGGDGGNTARLELNFVDASEFTLNQETPRVGTGGKESLGGRGSPGGYGGRPGPNNPQYLKKGESPCPNAPAGPEGEEGDRGPKGEAGKDGRFMPVCLKLSRDRAMECK